MRRMYVPDWFIKSDWVHMWYADSEYRDYNDEMMMNDMIWLQK